jgi:molybdopterin molybdotransferase
MNPVLTDVRAAIAKLLARVKPVGAERVAIQLAGGRVLAEGVATDRPSPPLDASAMDGFAVRCAELVGGPLPISGECRIGHPPRALPAGATLRIFTGSPVPTGADAVLRVEDAQVERTAVGLRQGAAVHPGDHIRLRGENAGVGTAVLAAGQSLSPAAVAALASLRSGPVNVFRKVRVQAIVTGDELLPAAGDEHSAEPHAWQLRDSNGPTLTSIVAPLPYATMAPLRHVGDAADDTRRALEQTLGEGDPADVIVLTGGVSKGDYDCVPDVIRSLGGEVIFHGLRLRPGKPALGAMIGATPIVALPGNPVSVMVTGRTLLGPVLRGRAGHTVAELPARLVTLAMPHNKALDLEWRRPVQLAADGAATLCPLRGSGDMIGSATSDGFVVIPPGVLGVGPFEFYPWNM